MQHIEAPSMFYELLEIGPDALVVADHDGIIVAVNGFAERLFGYARTELIGWSAEILVPPRRRDLFRSQIAELAARGLDAVPLGAVGHHVAARKDGSEFEVEVAMTQASTPFGTVVTAAVRDISERRDALAERDRQAARADRLERELEVARLESIGQLAGRVAHDFNNLLGVILNYTAFVREAVDAAAAHDPQWQGPARDLAEIGKAATRGAQLTRQLLAFGRREVVQPELLDLNTVVTSVEELLRRSIGEQVELRTRLDGNLRAMVADRGQVEQVLFNLAVNARDAMPNGGSLTIDTGNLNVDDGYAAIHTGVRLGKYVRLRVSDTGIGMAAEVLERAFEPFFTTKPRGEGSGLGLATVYGIITQAGGSAQFYSEPGLGTTFTALFPASDEAAAGPVDDTAIAPGAVAQGSGTVLIVEDEPAMLEVARRMLRRNGYTVLAASGGVEAIAIASEHPDPIDVLLTDVVMPKMLGAEVAEKIRPIQPNIKVMFMSGYAQPVLAERGTLEDGVVLLEKPFTEAALLAKLGEALAGD
jgi:PAS domain S-box-containing protein